MTRIVVPLDGSPMSERAIGTAQHFAELMNADVLLVQVVGEQPDHRREAERHKSEAYLQARRLNSMPSAEIRTVEARSPVQGILELVANEDVDLVVMSTHGRTGAREQPMGAVTRELMQSCPVPMMVVGTAA